MIPHVKLWQENASCTPIILPLIILLALAGTCGSVELSAALPNTKLTFLHHFFLLRYHPHYHGETTAQTGGGAFGMIVIPDDSSATLGSWATDLTNERLLQIVPGSPTLGNGKANGSESFIVSIMCCL